jgi:hypothetical protein
MSKRLFGLVMVTLFAAATISAQNPPAKPSATSKPAQRVTAGWKVARTPDGQPDLQGTWNVATLTPMERPAGAKENMTPEEAAAYEQSEAARIEKLQAPSSPERSAPPVGGDKSVPRTFTDILDRAGGGAVGGYNYFWIDRGSNVITMNGQRRTSLVIDPPDGRVPPLTPEAQKRNAAGGALAALTRSDAAENASTQASGAYDNPENRPLAERCLLGFSSTSGPPTLPNYFYNNLKQIVQTKDYVMILVEMVHDVRIIPLNRPHAPPSVRKWLGDSVGRWEGDTLVVETTNFTDKTRFRGASENLKVTERFTRLDDDTIVYRFTVEDPATWTRPWTGEYPWVRSDELIYEYACHEANYALSGILKGARLQERETAAR